MLSNKMKIHVRSKKAVEFPEKHIGYYARYSSAVLRTLRKPLFQRFLCWMLKKENIDEQIVDEVQVMVFPHRKRNGNGLAGKCNVENGEIRIYPKRLEFCRELKRKCGKETFLTYIKSRAKAALVHELLHMKYLNDEEKVRELTRKYFTLFFQTKNEQNMNANSILKMLFAQ